MKKEMVVEIEEELIQKFRVALRLTNEESEFVVSRFMKEYVIRTFKAEANTMLSEVNRDSNNVINESDENYGKAIKRIPKWASKSHQINNRIMKAFFLLEDGGKTKKTTMEELCNDLDSDIYVRDFNNNFNSMSTDAGKSHGKVFEVDSDGYVHLWDEVKSVAMEYKEEFLVERGSQIGLTDKIRQYILEVLIESKEEGLSTIDIRSGNIHKEMGLDNRMPSVCGAMETIEGFKEYEIVSDTPSGKSSTRIFRYKLRG
jgi:hypothetical protein